MASSKDYIAELRAAIWRLHQCGAVHRETVPVHEVFQGETVWKGDVEVFDLIQHPKAKRAYAWAHKAGPDDSQTRYVAVLEIPPVTSPQTAVQVQIVKDVKDTRSN